MDQLPTTLLDLLINPIISDAVLPYLPLSAKVRLSRTAKSYHNWVFNTPNVFRYLDLTKCKGAYTPFVAPIDSGGHSWRAERIDENLTEDEFYSGPLRNVLNKLQRRNILQDVTVLVLDNLGSVTNDIIYDIVTDPKYNVRLLSIRKCLNVNQARLQQLLQHICRPSRPEGTPRLQGLYFFTDPAHDSLYTSRHYDPITGITNVDGAALGLLPTAKASDELDNAHKWYSPAGRVTSIGATSRSSWEETLLACSGIISFDVVLCKAMHQAVTSGLHEASREFLASNKPGIPTIATVALGQEGCSGCGRPPNDSPTWGESNIEEFPLLAPPPFSGKLVDAVRPPKLRGSDTAVPQKLVVSCTWCLVNRHCDSCQRWWCSDCYNPKRSKKLRDLEALSNAGLDYFPSSSELQTAAEDDDSKKDSVKVFNGFCVEYCLVGEMMAGAGSNGMWA